MTKKNRLFIRQFWSIAGPYWWSEERWRARLLLAVIIAMNLGTIGISVLINKWNNAFYNDLAAFNEVGFFHDLLQFAGLASAYIVLAVYQLYLTQMLQIRWRRWLTDRYLNQWLDRHAYYRMQLLTQGTDNPDQRISQDINDFVDSSLNLSMGLLNAIVTLFSFVAILWGLSGTLHLPLGTLGVLVVPGYMVWAALIYALAGTLLTLRVGRPLISLNFNQQRYEADFRYSLVRLRENSESVALYGGEPHELAHFSHRFKSVVDNFWQIMKRQKKLTWLTSGYNQLAIIFPILVAAPRFFAHQMKLGGLMQTASAFGQVHGALSYLVNSYTDIAQWKAVVDRLITFSGTLSHVDALRAETAIERRTSDDNPGLEVQSLSVRLPDGTTLLRDVRLHLQPGTTLLLSGASGSGKSTLLRTLAGIWPFGDGTIHLPTAARVMFLPQKPYLPLGTLRQVLSYPRTDDMLAGDDHLQQVLEDCGLGKLRDRLDDKEDWAQTLSLGEQQRIALARVLLQAPDFIFLDEATASLDEPTEARLYQLLIDTLPRSVIVSVGHRSTLRNWHKTQVTLDAEEQLLEVA